MKAGDGAPGTAKLAVSGRRKYDCRTVIAILEPRRNDADHTLMPFPPVKAERARLDVDRRIECGERLVLHGGLDVTPLPVQAIELSGQALRGCRVVGHQAGDADRHVRESAGGIEARACDKAKVIRCCASRIAPAHGEQCRYPGLHASGPNAAPAL